MSKVFFTSDTHFDHKNIVKYCERPFSSVDEMNQAMIDNWNAVVDPQDTVYHLGDFAFGRKVNRVNHLIRSLNGHKFLIYGNHDKDAVLKSEGWVWKGYYKKIKVQGQSIILFHYATRVWDKCHRGSWMLYGHSHGSLPENTDAWTTDVGVDCHNFTPISFEQVGDIMSSRTYVPVDHHRPQELDNGLEENEQTTISPE